MNFNRKINYSRDLFYENITLCLIDQLDSITNSMTLLQKNKCRIRYARVFYLIRALKKNTHRFTPQEKTIMGWPVDELIKLAETSSMNTVNQTRELCISIDIERELLRGGRKKSKRKKYRSRKKGGGYNTEFHGPMSHPFNPTRSKSNTQYITEFIVDLKNSIKIEDTTLVFAIMGGAAIEKWLSILDPSMYKKFIQLYPTEDIDVNILIDPMPEDKLSFYRYLGDIFSNELSVAIAKKDRLQTITGRNYRKENLDGFEIIKNQIGNKQIDITLDKKNKYLSFSVHRGSKILIDAHFKPFMSYNKRFGRLNKITSKIKQHSLYKPDGITKGGIPLWSKISKYIVNKSILPSGGESLLVSL
jgi:hypothetical protein